MKVFNKMNKLKPLRSLLFMIIAVLLISSPHMIAGALNNSWTTDEQIDLDMGAIDRINSVRDNPDLLNVMEILLRAPIPRVPDPEPPYNQEPPDAQNDFRTAPPPTNPPNPPTNPPVPPTNPPLPPTNPPVPPTRRPPPTRPIPTQPPPTQPPITVPNPNP